MDPGGHVPLSDPLTMDTEGQLLQGPETLAACPEQPWFHSQDVVRGNWDDLAAEVLLPSASTTNCLLPQSTASGSTPVPATAGANTSNAQMPTIADQLDFLLHPENKIENERFHSYLNDHAVLSHALQLNNACGAPGSVTTHSSGIQDHGIATEADIGPSRDLNMSIEPALPIDSATTANDYIPDPNFDNLRMDYFDAASDADGNAVLAQEIHEKSDAMLRNLEETNHHDGTANHNLSNEPQQQGREAVTPGDELYTCNEENKNFCETFALPQEDDLCYDAQTGTLYSRGSSSVAKSPDTEQQNMTADEMDVILNKRVFIDEGEEAEEPAAKRRCVEDAAQENRDGRDGHEASEAPRFVVQGRTREGNFWFKTVIVYKRAICAQCEQAFPFQELLDAHIQSKHAEKPKKRTYRKRKRVQIHRCDKCQNIFKNAANLKRHQAIVHEGNVVAVCKFCDAPFSSQHGFTLHMRDRHNVVPSSVEKRFGPNVYEERALKKQQQKSSSDNNSGWTVHSCSSCQYWTEGKGNMQRHIKIAHMGLREFPCKYCSLQFKTKSNRDLHYVSKHPDKFDVDGKGNVQGVGDEKAAEEQVKELNENVQEGEEGVQEDVQEEDEVAKEELLQER